MVHSSGAYHASGNVHENGGIPPEWNHRTRRHEREHHIRLLRITEGGRRIAVVRDLPHELSSSRFALAPAPDGTLYLVASSDAVHVVVRLAFVDDEVHAIGFASGRGALAPGQARAAETGLTVLTVGRLDRPLAVEYGARSLSRPPRDWERRCF